MHVYKICVVSMYICVCACICTLQRHAHYMSVQLIHMCISQTKCVFAHGHRTFSLLIAAAYSHVQTRKKHLYACMQAYSRGEPYMLLQYESGL